MKIIKTSDGWLGQMNPGRPEEAETIDILGTDMIPLPFTVNAKEEDVRAFYSQKTVNGLSSPRFTLD